MAKPNRATKSLTFDAERALAGSDCACLAGVDEAGRGPWAGPVVAAAAVFDGGNAPDGLQDSKLLTAARRDRLYDAIRETARIGVGIVPVETIDKVNILQATLLAMQRAVEALGLSPHTVLIDGNACPSLACRTIAVVGGDGKCPSIAAASIIAKVTRDRLMVELAESFPGYGWHANKGYGTREHAEGIARLGITPHHRRSFAPIRAALADIRSDP
jgi:ribonuclease HII